MPLSPVTDVGEVIDESVPVPGVAVALVHEQDIIYFVLYVEGVQRDRLI